MPSIHKNNNILDIVNENESISNRSIIKATYFALVVSTILCIIKFLNYAITNSVAIHASALDSLLDITVSFANFITIKLTQRKSNAKFPYGYDKIASLVAFLQVILVSALAFHLFFECLEKLQNKNELHDIGYGIFILIFSLILNTGLVLYQSNVVKKTGSLIIKADMLHYKTDFLTNIAILVGLLFVKAFEIYWLDPLVGLVAAIYLFYAVFALAKTSLNSLLDTNDIEQSNNIIFHLNDNNIDTKNINVIFCFTGTKSKISIKVQSLDEELVNKIKTTIYTKFNNCIVEIILA